MATIISIASGKGGVGKTLITASLAVAFHRRGHSVLAIDADMGLRNLDLVFGVQNEVLYDIGDIIKDRCRPSEAIISLAPGLDFLAASQKHTWEKIDTTTYQFIVETLAHDYDYIFIDCPPGRDRAYKDAVSIADRLIFIVEPTWSSMRDTGRVMQFCNKHKRFNYDVLFNNFYGHDPAYVSVDQMIQLLDPEGIAGILPHDRDIQEAVQLGTILHASQDIPFFQALGQTVTYLETGQDVDIEALKALLPGEDDSLEEPAVIDKKASKGMASLRQRRQQSMAWRHYHRR